MSKSIFFVQWWSFGEPLDHACGKVGGKEKKEALKDKVNRGAPDSAKKSGWIIWLGTGYFCIQLRLG